MAISNIKAVIKSNISKVWKIIFEIENYSIWRNDLNRTEMINERQFVTDLKKVLA